MQRVSQLLRSSARNVTTQRSNVYALSTLSQLSTRHSSSAAMHASKAEDQQVEESARIRRLVDEISELSLRETSILVQQLKIALNITDIVAPSFAASAAPAAAAPAQAAPEVVEEKKVEKTEFTLKLEKFDAASKAKIIREIKNITGLNLVDAKKFVESAATSAQTIKENVPKADAEKIKKLLEDNGASVSLS